LEGLPFAGALAVGAALLGLWVDVRLGARRPESVTRRFIHAGIAFALVQIATAVFGQMTGGTTAQRAFVAFLLLLLSLVYAFLAAVWLVRALAEGARPFGR
jgi:hypothetical protein